MPWLQLFIQCEKPEAHNTENALLRAGALSVTLQEQIPEGENEKPILEPGLNETPLWDQIKLTGLFDANCDTQKTIDVISTHLKTTVTHRWEQLEDKDWEREWMSNYHPIAISDTLWICPSWCEPPAPEAINVMLDPGLAFGTGTHPTTFLCMQWLAKQSLSDQQVIDYGCGSGILGVTALLMGARYAQGIDIDPQALTATHDNVTRNGLDIAQFDVYLPQDFKPQAMADIVLANILAGPLVELKDAILAPLKKGGKLCLSGILVEQANAIMDAYSDMIRFDPISEKEGWMALSGQRKA